MKEKLYTIPLNEAFEKDTECPFCALYEELEKRALDYTMGPSYMEPDVRINTNSNGFCKKHFKMMYFMKNRLGLSLMVASHMKEIISKYESYYSERFLNNKKGFLSKKNSHENMIEKVGDSCFVCDKISGDMDKFFDTFIFMWRRDKAFRDKVLKSNGLCLEHFDKICELAYQKMSKNEFIDFWDKIYKKQVDDLNRVKDDLEWFIQKFDFRFKDEPWKNSKDALRRSIIKMAAYDPEKNEN